MEGIENCYGQRCEPGISFCETGKQVCRRCSDFVDTCWQNIYHIPNCTSYCLEHVPIITCNTYNEAYEIIAYVLPSVLLVALVVSVMFGVRFYLNYRRLLATTKTRSSGMTSSSTVSTDEQSNLMECENKVNHHDINTDIAETRSVDHNRQFFPPNQFPTTDDNNGTSKMYPSGKYEVDLRHIQYKT